MEYELGSTHKNKNKAALETPLKYRFLRVQFSLHSLYKPPETETAVNHLK